MAVEEHPLVASSRRVLLLETRITAVPVFLYSMSIVSFAGLL